jgi:hypothetical protein
VYSYILLAFPALSFAVLVFGFTINHKTYVGSYDHRRNLVGVQGGQMPPPPNIFFLPENKLFATELKRGKLKLKNIFETVAWVV